MVRLRRGREAAPRRHGAHHRRGQQRGARRAPDCSAARRALEAGRLAPIIDRVFDFHELIDAYRYMESNAQNGKIVVRGETPHTTQG
ncbi:hypothetical protein GY24_09665 [Microterricola pindariensis]|uniref:Alcohol dehydrogenase-like C-terminal domain-containing protein n=1 Tax=Microterricola pindariensis TaxID=478010 RepID=A0ABX5AV41_9MICO|nr:hypothetical protein GY24_09665 [Microterricola pindariensis]